MNIDIGIENPWAIITAFGILVLGVITICRIIVFKCDRFSFSVNDGFLCEPHPTIHHHSTISSLTAEEQSTTTYWQTIQEVGEDWDENNERAQKAKEQQQQEPEQSAKEQVKP